VEIGEDFGVFGLGYEGIRIFVGFWFWWMKVVFEWWVMFGMIVGNVLVKKFGELVEF